MNGNEILHPNRLENFPNLVELDTCITRCNHCGKSLLKFGEAVHCHEYHSGAIKNEVDDTVAERLAETGVAL